MPLILTTVSRRKDAHGVAEEAPGGVGSVRRKDGADWFVAEREVDPAAQTALVEYLDAASPGAATDWAVTPAEGRRKKLLVSDMDSTIIGQECLDELADFAGLKAEVSAITERAMRGELDFASALTERVRMLKGLKLSALEACYRERVTLNAGATQLVATMKAHGARCVLVSGGFGYFTSRVAKAAGFDADQANTLEEAGDALSGEVRRPILGREAKLAALQGEAGSLGVQLAATLAMGDGANDLDMIRAAGLGVAYRAKPIVARETLARIEHTDLRAALFFQGYDAREFVGSE